MIAAFQRGIVGMIALACIMVALGCTGGRDAPGGPMAPLPAVDATPEQVVAAFVAAWSADDRPTMRSLATEPFWASFSSTSRGVRTTFSNVEIVLSTDRPPGSRSRSWEVAEYAQVVSVLFQAEVRQRPVATWDDGLHHWGFETVRNTDDERWLIGAAGLG